MLSTIRNTDKHFVYFAILRDSIIVPRVPVLPIPALQWITKSSLFSIMCIASLTKSLNSPSLFSPKGFFMSPHPVHYDRWDNTWMCYTIFSPCSPLTTINVLVSYSSIFWVDKHLTVKLTLKSLTYRFVSGQYFYAWTLITFSLLLGEGLRRRITLRFFWYWNGRQHTRNGLLP